MARASAPEAGGMNRHLKTQGFQGRKRYVWTGLFILTRARGGDPQARDARC